ncbi:Preprotein translocase subunit YajC [Chondromyces apiculatus DSM 436]|uniref:Sec translocon accessory complex subunit YajC n=2 Tax=Chondromyces apiculatus TaxID=51 RepID=A0A017TET4_9BACT|nr:Preprotein translocase subunit YajC [Chondromyces apiculatus DSM 436]
MMVMFALTLVFLFVMTRNQSKRQKQLESSLKSGDRVLTQSGLVGKIVEINPNTGRVKLEIAPGVNVQILKTAIQGVDGGETPAETKDKAAEKVAEKASEKK